MPRNRNGSGSEKRITPRLERAVQALIDGEADTNPKAAEIAGLNERSFRKALNKPHVQEFIRSRIRSRFSTVTAIKAARVVDHLQAAESEYVRLDAAKHALAIAGVKPSADGAGGGAAGGLVINLNLNHAHASPLLDAISRAASVQPTVIEAQPVDAHEE